MMMSLRQAALWNRSTLAQRQLRLLSSSASHVYDVLIVGGGVVGSGLARLLQDTLPTASVGLLERGPGPSAAVQKDVVPNARCYALSPKSLGLLGENTLSKLQPAYYDTMQVWEQDSPSLVLFTSKDLESTEYQDANYLGAVVEDSALVNALWDQIRGICIPDTQLQELHVDDNVVRVTTSQGKTYSTRLLVAADGGNSWVRKTCGMAWNGFDYNRSALTCTVQLSTPMPTRAFQRFLPTGPLALLPTRSPNHATIVWSTTPQEALEYKDAPPQELVERVNSILQQGPQRIPPLLPTTDGILGNVAYGVDRVIDTLQYGLTMAHWSDHDETFYAPPRVESIAGPRIAFPLTCRQVDSYLYKNRVVLVGDAAHTCHPMAGQGLNLGLDDVGALVDCIQRAHEAGMEVTSFLQDYAKTQAMKNAVRIHGIHALHEVFGNHTAVMQHAKSLGMHAVNHVGPVRKQLAAVAAGAI